MKGREEEVRLMDVFKEIAGRENLIGTIMRKAISNVGGSGVDVHMRV